MTNSLRIRLRNIAQSKKKEIETIKNSFSRLQKPFKTQNSKLIASARSNLVEVHNNFVYFEKQDLGKNLATNGTNSKLVAELIIKRSRGLQW